MWIMLLMVGLLLLGLPMLVPLLAGAFAILLSGYSFLKPELAIQQMIGGLQPVVLTAVPMFILAADIMLKGSTAQRMLDVIESFVGHWKGGLPVTTAMGCTMFGAVSGSTQATVVAMGRPLRPRLLDAGYSDKFTIALIINASDIALLIPPSIGMIIYGVATGTSVGDLFIAGILPGLLILVLFSIYCIWKSNKLGIEPLPRKSWAERWHAVKRASLPAGFPVIIIGGIYSGMFSPTEAATVSVLYALLLEMVIYRGVSFSDLPKVAFSTGLITAVVFILVAAGAAFSWIISFAKIPDAILGGYIPFLSEHPFALLIVIAAAFFVGCMFVDPIVVILILSPVFAPAIETAGLDPVHVGVLVTLQAAIGSATPPFGCDIFTAVAVFRKPYLDIIRGTPPFIALLLLATALIIAFPQISLFLPNLAN
ncbi:TRAP transporter large permease [Modicisalibacter xianhensis]|uniref:TRAP transporter large permease protein n=1 Tax=Modicisalibacter xianhensis TaxID=442341 RepID=A0A1I3BDS7_9GAMM|nr:TRAP transporter large permease [Halomonas xianhensis]SFH60428.1 TRAP transporter, DctM subunit [Halomonas xianhensis]